ncbi:hypothetical protein [Kitasatospora indigofera]
MPLPTPAAGRPTTAVRPGTVRDTDARTDALFAGEFETGPAHRTRESPR